MECCGYALKSGFSSYLATHPDMLKAIDKLSDEQKRCMVDTFNEQNLWERAVHYFDNDHIYLKDHVIYYENKWKRTVYTMEIKEYVILLSQWEDNPFLPFLQRIFRNFLTCIKKE